MLLGESLWRKKRASKNSGTIGKAVGVSRKSTGWVAEAWFSDSFS